VKIINKAILPSGFKASAKACGLKRSGKLDLALFYSQVPAQTAAVFTTNTMAAAPVTVCREHLKKGKLFQAIIANSGNANCFTGVSGLKISRLTAEAIAGQLKIKKEAVLVGSTGLIGKPLDFPKIKAGIPDLVKSLSSAGIGLAKKAIMTTDKFPKEITVRFKLGAREVTVCAVAKGAGMIAPDMATMFAFIFTDCRISQAALSKALKLAVERSFNCISVDGCMSTNDTVAVLANGQAGNTMVEKGLALVKFQQALDTVCLELAKMMVKDGEGATKFIQIDVQDAASYAEAKKAGLAVANSNLFKTAVYGQNPNFGRIVAAIGASGIKVKESRLKIKLGDLKTKTVKVKVSLGRGSQKCSVYTSDLTPEYIKINAAYN
jgi:glutamate N-acetyltransferase / amino-acid N-acetyltransferase